MSARRPATFAALLLAAGCGSRPADLDRSHVTGKAIAEMRAERVPVRGSQVRLDRIHEKIVEGELLAASADALCVRVDDESLCVPARELARVSLQVRPSEAGELVLWGLGGALTTISHGLFLVITAPGWIVVTTASAVSSSVGATTHIEARNDLDLRILGPYARFPQGLPPGFGPASGPAVSPP